MEYYRLISKTELDTIFNGGVIFGKAKDQKARTTSRGVCFFGSLDNLYNAFDSLYDYAINRNYSYDYIIKVKFDKPLKNSKASYFGFGGGWQDEFWASQYSMQDILSLEYTKILEIKENKIIAFDSDYRDHYQKLTYDLILGEWQKYHCQYNVNVYI